MNEQNPFLLTGYISPKYFCDREKETIRVIDAIKNNRNLTLFSHRRIGKTGLLHHIFYKMQKNKEYSTFYLDIQDTSNINEFTKELAKTVIGKLDSFSERVIKNIGKVFSNLRPTISYDSFSGEPKINFKINNVQEANTSLEQIIKYLEEQNKHIVVAIDEFQQILNYPEKNVEALLRKLIQRTKNISFVFAGSHKHMLMSMFKDHSRPFYQSSELMNLDKIDFKKYKKFIIKNFTDGNKTINEVEVDFILEWTKRHTFYTQFVCNRLYSLNIDEISLSIIQETTNKILEENRVVFNNYKNLLSSNQWKLLKAIAKEDSVKHISAKEFMHKHNLGTPSSINGSLKVLLDKEMVYQDEDNYQVVDLFLSRWLEQKD